MRPKRSVRRKADAEAQQIPQPAVMQQPPSKTEAFLKRARDTLDEQAYIHFGNVLRDFQSGRVMADDLIDQGREIFAQYPDLLNDFLSFAPAPRDARPVFVPVTPAISSRLVTNAAPSVLHRVDMLGSVGQTSASTRSAVHHVYFASVDNAAGRRRLAAREQRRSLRASQNEDRLLDSLHAPPEGSLAWHLAHGRVVPVVSPRDCASNISSRSSAVVARSRVNVPSLHEERTVYAAARAARIAAVLNLPSDKKHSVVAALSRLRTPTLQHARMLFRTLSRSTQRPQVKQQLENALLCYLRGEVGPSSLFLRMSTLLSPYSGVPDETTATMKSAVGAFFPGIATAFSVRDARLEAFQHAQRQRVLAERARGLKGTEGTPLFGPSYVRAMRNTRVEAYRHADAAYDALSSGVINLTLVSRAPPSRGNSTEWGIVAASAQLELEFLEHLAKVDTLINQIDGALHDFREGRAAPPDASGPPALAEVTQAGRRAAANSAARRNARGRRGGGSGMSPGVSPSSSPPMAPMEGLLPELPPLVLGLSLATEVDPRHMMAPMSARRGAGAAGAASPSGGSPLSGGESPNGGPLGADALSGGTVESPSASVAGMSPDTVADAAAPRAAAPGVAGGGGDGDGEGAASPMADGDDADLGDDVAALLPEGATPSAARGIGATADVNVAADVPLALGDAAAGGVDAMSDVGSLAGDLEWDEAIAPGPEPGEDSPYDANVPRSSYCTLLRDANELRRMRSRLQLARADLIAYGPHRLGDFLVQWSENEPDVFPPPSIMVEDYA